MRLRSRIWTLWALSWGLLWATGLPAQLVELPSFHQAQLVKGKAVELRTGEVEAPTAALTFDNLYDQPRFENEKLRREINLLKNYTTNLDSLRLLDQRLEQFISRFGIENFIYDLDLLWLAGRSNHILQDTQQAVFYYEMAKLHERGQPAPRLRYDSLVAPTRSEWLPIDKYYESLKVRQKVDPLIPPRKVLESMGDMINSDDPDYAPYMHPSNGLLIFTSRRDTSGIRSADFKDPFSRTNEDLYLAEIDFVTDTWSPAYRLPDTINSQLNEGSACLSPDGLTLYFTRCGAKGGMGECDIFQAEYDPTDGSWKKVRNLGANVNSIAWDSQPNISADGNVLFFTSNRKGGFGGTDLFFCTRDGDGWSPAKNLGPVINTSENEVTPFFHSVNETLFFSSTGQLKNYGGYDIFKSRWRGESWEFAKNVGPLVNTGGNEYYFSIDGKGETLFYAKSENPEVDHVMQNFDLYSFPMPMEARPDAIAELKGYLVDSVSGHVLQGTVMIIDLENGVEVAPKEINEDGYFSFDLINNNRYQILVMGDDFLTIKNEIVMSGDTTFEIFTQSFEQNKPIVFEAMEFRSNSSRLKASVKPKLDYIVRFLQTYPMFKLEVEGHTDADGDEDANMRLSQERAFRIGDYITRKGSFKPERVTHVGYGETRPIVPNDSDENKAKNRRVEFKLVFDETYSGDMWLPTEEELYFDEDLGTEFDAEFDREFDWSDEERDSWEEELELEETLSDELDLEKELEAAILEVLRLEELEKKKD